MEYPSPIFLRGAILEAVQEAAIFADSKEFVDMPMKKSPAEVQTAFYALPNKQKETVKKFVEENFDKAGSDLEAFEPGDWKDTPCTLKQEITHQEYLEWALHLNGVWKKLVRKTKAQDYPERHSLLHSEFPIVIPGGRFRESYYWDSYWSISGLLACEMLLTAKGVVMNLLNNCDTYGYVPNGGRSYYLTRSQPPFLTEMVAMIYRSLKDKPNEAREFLNYALPILKKEHAFWMSEKRSVSIRVSNGKTLHLNRYSSDARTQRPESFREDTKTSDKGDREQICRELVAGAESGWDYTIRYICKSDVALGVGLENIDVTNVLPVDLNVILLRMENHLSNMCRELGTSDAETFRLAADNRAVAINEVMWDGENNMWKDFLLKENCHSSVVSISNFFPLWGGLGHGGRKEFALNALEKSGLLRPWGCATTNVSSEQQWDGDNAWPPLQDILVESLLEDGDERGERMAMDLVKKWLKSCHVGWQKKNNDGVHEMHEKYLASQAGERGLGGEYESQVGFGWTNGVVLKFLVKYAGKY